MPFQPVGLYQGDHSQGNAGAEDRPKNNSQGSPSDGWDGSLCSCFPTLVHAVMHAAAMPCLWGFKKKKKNYSSWENYTVSGTKQIYFLIPNEKDSQYQHSSLCPLTTIMKIQGQLMDNHKKNPPVLRVQG